MKPSPDSLPIVLQARNDKPRDVTLVLEPWGEEVVLLSGVTVTVTVHGVRAQEVEFVWGEQDVTLFAAPGSTVEVADSGPSGRNVDACVRESGTHRRGPDLTLAHENTP